MSGLQEVDIVHDEDERSVPVLDQAGHRRQHGGREGGLLAGETRARVRRRGAKRLEGVDHGCAEDHRVIHVAGDAHRRMRTPFAGDPLPSEDGLSRSGRSADHDNG